MPWGCSAEPVADSAGGQCWCPRSCVPSVLLCGVDYNHVCGLLSTAQVRCAMRVRCSAERVIVAAQSTKFHAGYRLAVLSGVFGPAHSTNFMLGIILAGAERVSWGRAEHQVHAGHHPGGC